MVVKISNISNNYLWRTIEVKIIEERLRLKNDLMFFLVLLFFHLSLIKIQKLSMLPSKYLPMWDVESYADY